MTAAMQSYRLTDETVALVATVSALPSGAVAVLVDGDLTKPRFVVGAFVSRSGRPLLLALGPRPVVGGTVAFAAPDGASLAQATLPTADEIPWLDIDAVIEALQGPADRLRVVRHLFEAGTFHLKLGAVPRFLAQRDQAIKRAIESSTTCRVERAIRLERGLILWIFHGVPAAAVQAVHLYRHREVRPNPFKPVVLGHDERSSNRAGDGVPRTMLLTDGWEDDGGIERILMWGQGRLWSPEVREQFFDVRSGILPFAQSLGAQAHRLVACLAASLGPYLPTRPALRSVLLELSAMCPPGPPRALTSERPIGVGVDLSMVTNEGLLFASGWIFDPQNLIARLSWIHPSGRRIPLSDTWVETRASTVPERYHAQGLKDSATGFAAMVRGAGVGRWLPQQQFEVELRSGATFELTAPAPSHDPAAARDAVLSIVPEGDLTEKLVAQAVGPVVAALQRDHLAGDRIQREIVVGDMPFRPAVSIVVPIYKVLEFLRYQISAFALDPDFADAELLLVVDSPNQADDVEGRVRALHGLYGLPARIVVHRRNLGYAPAINTGISSSRGGTLVLMNSDVVPAGPGWLSALRRRLADTAGAVGPKLLFHDDSIQHAGMAFGRDLRGDYFNYHKFKGYPRDYPEANISRRVEALTGACLMISRHTYVESGGLSEDYIVGDFEDSDLSFRIKSIGKTLWYEPAAELYHYERQSIAQNESYTKTRACSYNRWLHTQRWKCELDQLTQKAMRVCNDPAANREPG